MKNICLVLFIFGATYASAQDLKVMTFNIRLNIASDSMNAWPHRKDNLASEVLYHHTELLGVQEALNEQMEDLQQRLPAYKFIGGGREDGKKKGEYSAIFYDTSMLQLLQTQTFWLSETPAVPGSVGWDAAITRIVTWGKFRYKKSNKLFYAFNTHFDHMGKIARRESAHLLLRKVKEIAGTTPAVITGDFNSTPQDEPIIVVKNEKDPLHFADSKDLSQQPHYGPTGTFTGFGAKERDEFPIDYIFVKGKWKVKDHATISQSWNGRFASDHFAVLATLVL